MFLALDVAALHQAREALLGRGLAVLAAWVLLNLLVSGHYLSRADKRRPAYYFHGMNVGWALVNGLLAAWGIYHLQPAAPSGLGLADVVQAQLFNENLFLFNAGLDVAYIMTGYYLRARAALPGETRPARLLGFGRSLWLQGGFLLVFDALMWGWLHWQGRGWLPWLQ
ncbi:DUF6992 family protein [Hymenobacter armeniacus]|uniref:Uncharacterized protein n=1 Tax=Hymenobacter armeniacus TaxID=2771358 RepID=A0ABR8JYW7_9BACT|nr:hypothetical protein [Hymenobacter armeniacus]MBD2724385.1 hypothetical protein [Hymenobacter armeniacus]